jgi:lactate permease
MAQRAAAVPAAPSLETHRVARAWMPWIFLSIAVIVWGLPATKAALTGPILAPAVEVPLLHRMVFRDSPVVATRIDPARVSDPGYRKDHGEAAVLSLNWASATGTAILLATLVSALYLRVSFPRLLTIAGATFRRMRAPLATIMLMLSLGFVTRYGGTDATLGLAFTHTGWLYPFFATLLGWLGVALTGSDTSSNVLFGSLQKITAQQLGFNPVLIVTANSTGGVMGKMIDAQSIVVATASTGQSGQEGRILRFVFWHSLALATIMGGIVMLQAYWASWMVP